jgi:hypothetical protein
MIRHGILDYKIEKSTSSGSSEMIRNGGFINSDYWTLGSGWTIASNKATYDKTVNSILGQATEDMVYSIEEFTAYTCTFTVSGTSGGGLYMSIRNSEGIHSYVTFHEYNNGDKIVHFITDDLIGTAGFSFFGNIVGDSGGSITNVSLTKD